jgi:hypothetical protein
MWTTRNTLVLGLVLALSICSGANAALEIQIDFNDTNGTQTTANTASGPVLGGADPATDPDPWNVYSSDDAPPHSTGGSSGQFTDGRDLIWGQIKEKNTQITLTSWIKPSSIVESASPTDQDNDGGGGGNAIWDGFWGGGGDGWGFYVYDAEIGTGTDYRLGFTDHRNSVSVLSSANAISLDEWQFVAVSVAWDDDNDQSTKKLYVGDGTTLTEVGSAVDGGGWVHAGSIWYGSEGKNAIADFEGLLDNGRLYENDALSASELTTVMQYNDMIPEPATMGLLAMGSLALLRRRRS